MKPQVFPYIGLRDITTPKTPGLLIPIRAAESKEIYEIAARLQQRIAAVMRYAVRSGIIWLNPAIDTTGAATTLQRQHRPALNPDRVPELINRIDTYKDNPSLA